MTGQDPRIALGRALSGNVIEVGPGSDPFPIGPDAHVRYADRTVEGGRDTNWPELTGSADGPQADFNIHLDLDGMAPFADNSLDAVIASHLIEHVANPIWVLREFERVLRPGGRLALVIPDRNVTFDAVRQPTPLALLLAKYEQRVTTISDDEIREFCTAIYYQPPIHPDTVREWHNPLHLSAERFDLHRRRSIHVHCWSTEEFASFIVGLLAKGLGSWTLAQIFLPGEPRRVEFGLLLERGPATGRQASVTFAREWVAAVRATPGHDPRRVARFACALHRDLSPDDLVAVEAALS